MMRPMRFLALCCALLVAGCSGGGREVNPARLLGRPMTVPADLWERTGVEPDGMKILVYYDRSGCTSCRLKQLRNWQDRIDELERLKRKLPMKADFVFVLRAAADDRQFTERIGEYGFTGRVYFDAEGEFERRNVLPEDPVYHCFLLNRNDQVLLVGAPIFSPTLWERYRDKLVAAFAPSEEP